MKLKFPLTLALSILLGMTAPAYADPMKVFVDGKETGITVTPYMQKETTMVPAKDMFQAMGAQVNYYPLNQQITARKNGTEVNLRINWYPAFINGKQTWLTVAPTLVDGKTYIPLSLIGESFNANINFNQAWGIIDIRSIKPAETPKPEPQETSRIAWQVSLERPANTVPVLDQQGSILLTAGTKLLKFNPDGQETWEIDLSRKSDTKEVFQKLGEPNLSSNGHVYVGSNDRKENFGFTKSLYHVLPDGSLKWEFLTATDYQGVTTNETAGAVVAPENYVYTTMKKSLYQVYVDGIKRWEYKATKELSNKVVPVGLEGAVLILETGSDGRLYRVDEKGRQDWYREISGTNDGNILLMQDKNRVFIVTQAPTDKVSPSTIYCIDSETGNYVWTYRSKEPITTPLAIFGDEIIYGTATGLQKISHDGKHLGTISTEKILLPPVVTRDGDIAIYNGDNQVKLINKLGEVQWTVTVPGEPIGLADGEHRIYVATKNNLLLAIKK